MRTESRYTIFSGPCIAALEYAFQTRGLVTFSVLVWGVPELQTLRVSPVTLRYNGPSGGDEQPVCCILTGLVWGDTGPTNQMIEGAYHVQSLSSGGFNDV